MSLENEVKSIAYEVFGDDLISVTIQEKPDSNYSNYSGTFANIYVQSISITKEEKNHLEQKGLHEVEQAAHIVKNPDMDKSIDSVPVDKIADAGETEMELVVELE